MYLCIFHMKSEKQSFSTTRLGSLAIGGVPVYFPGRDFPTQSPAGDYKEVPCHHVRIHPYAGKGRCLGCPCPAV